MSSIDEQPVLVQVVDVHEGREIAWGANAASKLDDRMDDIRKAIIAGTKAVSNGLSDLTVADQWEIDEVSASFGITLTAEAGVLLTRAGAEATFEMSITFKRRK
jgi:hypothetical protein